MARLILDTCVLVAGVRGRLDVAVSVTRRTELEVGNVNACAASPAVSK